MVDEDKLLISLSDAGLTKELGRRLAALVDQHAVVCLNGPLGAGKTTLTQGVGEQLGVQEVINSPTFTMLNEYTSGRLPLYHLDLYRLSEDFSGEKSDNSAALAFLSAELEELISAPGLTLVEWADLYGEYFAQIDHLSVELAYKETAEESASDAENNERVALISANDILSTKLMNELRNVYFS